MPTTSWHRGFLQELVAETFYSRRATSWHRGFLQELVAETFYSYHGGGVPMLYTHCDGCTNRILGVAPRQLQVSLHAEVRSLDFCATCFADPLTVERALGKAVQSMRASERGTRAHERESLGITVPR